MLFGSHGKSLMVGNSTTPAKLENFSNHCSNLPDTIIDDVLKLSLSKQIVTPRDQGILLAEQHNAAIFNFKLICFTDGLHHRLG
jgi:hypothetical protein